MGDAQREIVYLQTLVKKEGGWSKSFQQAQEAFKMRSTIAITILGKT